jgi:ech hydrogenase subunit D
MIEQQDIILVDIQALTGRVKELFDTGYRLVQIGATKTTDAIEINYSFDKDYKFVNLRIVVPSAGTVVPSVSGIYWNAFFYENEIHDLFGVTIEGIAVDYKGKFYRIAVKTPFGGTV